MTLCRDKVLVKRFFHDSPPAHSILIPSETRSDRAVPTRDRFSTLPVEIKLKILEHIPFEEAARTSIMSSTSNWSEHSQVILDKLLFEERGRWIALHPTAWVNKVTKILTIHREGLIPIRKFILHIPDMQFNWTLYINIWISFLSSNGIQELSVDNWNIITYKLSSFLLECNELTRLMLRNCIFKQPVEGFQNLQFLRLEKIAFGSDIVGDVTLSTPSLVQAELVDCTGFQYLNIHAPELKNFVFTISDGMSCDDLSQTRLKVAHNTYFEGLKNLRCLCLQKMAFGSHILGDVTLCTPSLVRLELVDCMGFQYLNIHAPELKNFVFTNSDGMSCDDLSQMRLKVDHNTFFDSQKKVKKLTFNHLLKIFRNFLGSPKSKGGKVNHLELWTKAKVALDWVEINMDGSWVVSY